MAYPSSKLYPSAKLYPSDDSAHHPTIPAAPTVAPSPGSFILCDQVGRELAELEVDHTIRFEVSRAASTKFNLGYDQSGAQELITLLAGGYIPQVRAYRGKDIFFSGHWSPQQESAGGGENPDGITCEFRSPFSRLEGRYLTSVWTPRATDAGQIAMLFLTVSANAESPTGLIPGTVIPTVLRDRDYEIGQQIAQAIIDLTEVQDGFAFTETMLDSSLNNGALAKLNIWNVYDHSTFGRDLSSTVQFEYGEKTINNVLSVQRTITSPVNRVIVTGGQVDSQTLMDQADDIASQTRMGIYAATYSFTDIIDPNTLREKARGMLRPDFVQTVSFQPDINVDPRPGEDYWLGDYVSFRADKDALQIDTTTQINVIEFERDGNCRELSHRLEFGAQTVQPLIPVRRGRKIVFRDPVRT